MRGSVVQYGSTEPYIVCHSRVNIKPLVRMRSEGYCSWIVCLSVRVLVNTSRLEHLFVLKMLSHTQWTMKVKKFADFSKTAYVIL